MEWKYLFIDFSIYVEIIPCLIGYYQWKFLTLPLKTYLLFFSIVRVLGITSVVLANMGTNNHFIYPIISIVNGIGYGLFFQQFFNNRLVKFVLGGLYLFFVFITVYILINRTSKILNLQPNLLLDILCSGCAIFLLKRLIFRKASFRHEPLFWIALTILIVFSYSILLSTIGGKVLLYLSDYWQDIFWLGINPIINLIRASLISYAFYLTSRQRFLFNRIPDL